MEKPSSILGWLFSFKKIDLIQFVADSSLLTYPNIFFKIKP